MIHRHLIYVIVVGVNLNFSRAQYNFRIAQPTSPQFALTETQNKYLLPTDRDVLEDMLLPTVKLLFLVFIYSFPGFQPNASFDFIFVFGVIDV